MDIKLKKCKMTGFSITIVRFIVTVVLLAAVVSVHYEAFWMMARYAASQAPEGAGYDNLDMEKVKLYYRGCYVLYTQQEKLKNKSISEIFLSDIEDINVDNYTFDIWESEFNGEKSYIDYYVDCDGDISKNTEKNIEVLLEKNREDIAVQEELENLNAFYKYYFCITFDENGKMQTEVENAGDLKPDTLIKGLKELNDSKYFFDLYYSSYDGYEEEDSLLTTEQVRNKLPNLMKNVTVIYGVPRDSNMSFTINREENKSYQWISILGYLVMLVLLFWLAMVMSSAKIWKYIGRESKKTSRYLPEMGMIGIVLLFLFYQWYKNELKNVTDIFLYQNRMQYTLFRDVFIMMVVITILGYGTVLCFTPLCRLGMKGYVRNYSLIYKNLPWLRTKWEQMRTEIQKIDLNKKPVKEIAAVATVNFLILSFICLIGSFGIIFLLLYTVILVWIFIVCYDSTAKNYRNLLKRIEAMAEGKLDDFEKEDMGMFNPMKEKLGEVREGFQSAVEEEIKSQRMKTELITNVSHDLKTPLTGITTYIELLKKPDITEEEKISYVNTLEAKALRLKVLIEDLFEVSRAESENISLNLTEVDLVKLVKQVAVEHLPQMEKKELELRWKVPEKAVLQLDGEKTYRIFENLFMNVQKYAMDCSRVYVDIAETKENVEVIIKNISAEELNIAPEELTERFVRGDQSRNSDGSGLGLAIVKSFVQLQGGTFQMEVDGDLFKVILKWNKDKTE